MSTIDTETTGTTTTPTTPTPTGTTPTTTATTTATPTNTTTSTATATTSGVDTCSRLGSKEGSLKLIGCVDYRKGSHVLGIATRSFLSESASNKGSDVTFSGGAILTRALGKSSFLNYLDNGVELKNNFELELGVMGSDLKRVDSNKYHLLDSGTANTVTDLRTYIQN